MNVSQSRESLVFDYRSLRLIIGALALAFPAVVCALAGRITTSISASYHEAATRDVFVGFTFILGALMIAYRGHRLPVSFRDGPRLWVWVRRREEDWISAIGGIAAILTALFPTACDGCSPDTKARIHALGAFLLFFNVAYFSLIAFLRSLNKKLQAYDELKGIPKPAELGDGSLFWRSVNYLVSEIRLFRVLVREVSRRYDEAQPSQREKSSLSYRKDKTGYLLSSYGEKILRGYIYVSCGLLITLELVVFVPLGLLLPGLVTAAKLTFVVEAVALWLFGFAWMTASHLPFVRKIRLFRALRSREQALVLEAGAA
jgi:hypothetical protein